MVNIKVILTFFIINLTTVFSQTTYYISNSEGNDSNNGITESSPWKSLNKLHSSWNQIGPGDRILLNRGDIWEPAALSDGRIGLITIPEGKTGSRGNPIVFDAYGTGADPIISADNIFAGGGYIDGLRTKHFGWFEFRNIYFDCSIKLLAQYSSHNSIGLNHITFYGCTFEQSPVMTIGVTGQSTYAYNPYPSTVNSSSQVPVLNDDLFPKIRSMRIEHCTFIECTSNGGALNFAPYDSCYIGYNTFYDSGEEAIDLAGGYDHVIEYNKIYKAGYNGIKLHSQIYPFERAIVRGNVIVGNGMISQYGVSGAGLGLENITDCQVYNNTVYGWAYALWVGNVDREPPTGYYGNFEGNTIVNNIFIGQVIVRGTWENKYFSAPPAFPGADVLMPFTNQTGYIGVGSPENGRYGNGMFELNTFSNNTYYRDHDMFIRFGSNVSNDYYFDIPLSEAGLNSYWYPAASDNDVFGLPTFTNPHSSGAIYTDLGSLDPYNPGEYELDASSTAEINTGVYVEGYTQDLDGNPIVGIPDRGAYEFNGADITAPRVTSASLINETTLLVSFSEPLNVSTANNSNNYSISNGITVNIAAISGYQVTLTTSAHPSGDFTVTVNNVQDLAGNVIDPIYQTKNYVWDEPTDTLAVVSYNFVQGSNSNTIYDISQYGPPVNLLIENLSDITWVEEGGIRVNYPTKIVSVAPPIKISTACMQTGELSLEILFKPLNLNQDGPARIVSFSSNPTERNFTLGQGTSSGLGDVIDMRLRTTESNGNGLPSLTTDPGQLTSNARSHVVFTKNHEGIAKIYLNTKEVLVDTIEGEFLNWDESFQLVLANEFTGDRPWLGEIYKLSIFNLALSENAINSLYNSSIVTNFEDTYSPPSNGYLLFDNYPNPFNPSTKIKFAIPQSSKSKFSKVKINIYDILGKKIQTLFNEVKTAGVYEVEFDGRNLTSGVYFYTLEVATNLIKKKMILLK